VHNSWKSLSDEAYVSVGQINDYGISQSGGTLKIMDFVMSPHVAIMLRIEYRVAIPSTNKNETAYFSLGWTIFLPHFNQAGELIDQEIFEEVTMGPGLTPTGDFLWNPNFGGEKEKFSMRISANLSTSESADAMSTGASFFPS
jgi:hypothetical protein